MSPHAKHQTRFYGDIDERCPSRLKGHYFDINHTVIKPRLPEKILSALYVISSYSDICRPDVIRGLLFAHTYGRAEYIHLHDRIAERRSADHLDIVFSRKRVAARARAVRVYFLGKSMGDFKLEMPLPMKNDLEHLAERLNEPLSAYV